MEQARRGREEEPGRLRTTLRDLAKEHDELVNTVHRDEMARAQQRMRIEQLEERALEELGLAPRRSPPSTACRTSSRRHRRRRARSAGPTTRSPSRCRSSARSSRSGCAPPSGPCPCSARSTRSRWRSSPRSRSVKFLTEQLEDLRKTRKDLLDIVREVDERVEQVFTEAWNDVQTAFDHVFKRLFPGGEGRLILTNPADMLTTGVEAQAAAGQEGQAALAAPAASARWSRWRSWSRCSRHGPRRSTSSTRWRRRSTTTWAGSFARDLRGAAREQPAARDHPPEADDGNGDALYGVTMGDGVSAVISQRLRETAAS